MITLRLAFEINWPLVQAGRLLAENEWRFLNIGEIIYGQPHTCALKDLFTTWNQNIQLSTSGTNLLEHQNISWISIFKQTRSALKKRFGNVQRKCYLLKFWNRSLKFFIDLSNHDGSQLLHPIRKRSLQRSVHSIGWWWNSNWSHNNFIWGRVSAKRRLVIQTLSSFVKI